MICRKIYLLSFLFLASCAPTSELAHLSNLQEIVANPDDTFVAFQITAKQGALVPTFCSAQFGVEYKLTSSLNTTCFFSNGKKPATGFSGSSKNSVHTKKDNLSHRIENGPTDVHIAKVDAGLYFPAIFKYGLTHNIIVVEPVSGEVPIFEFLPGKVNYIGSFTKKEGKNLPRILHPDWKPAEIKPALERSSVPILSNRLVIKAPQTGFITCDHPKFLKNLRGIKCVLKARN